MPVGTPEGRAYHHGAIHAAGAHPFALGRRTPLRAGASGSPIANDNSRNEDNPGTKSGNTRVAPSGGPFWGRAAGHGGVWMKFWKMLTALFLVLSVGAMASKPPKNGPTVGRVTPAPKTGTANHKFTVKQAQAIALKKCPGKIVGATTLGKANGKWDYMVNVKSRKGTMCVCVNADTGKVDKV